jgi:signal peptidase I
MSVEKPKGSIGETLRTIVYAVLVAVVIRTLAFEPFNIPSESMLPTLLVGDYLFVSKYSYGYSRHSLPWSPDIFSGRVVEGAPKRGDIAVFKLPRDNSTDYIKRIIGLPGDRIQMKQGELFLNGELVTRERVDDFVFRDSYGNVYFAPQYRETLPSGASYLTLDLQEDSNNDNTREYLVPPGHFFAMGDNRDNSLDSRVDSAVGLIPSENLVGRAEILFFSTNGSARFWEFWNWPFTVRYSRLFDGLRT